MRRARQSAVGGARARVPPRVRGDVFRRLRRFRLGTASAHVVFLPDTMALAVSVALNLWALSSTLNYTAAFLEVDADASRGLAPRRRRHVPLPRGLGGAMARNRAARRWPGRGRCRRRAATWCCGGRAAASCQATRAAVAAAHRASDACLFSTGSAGARGGPRGRRRGPFALPVRRREGRDAGRDSCTRREAEAFLGLAALEEEPRAARSRLPSAALAASYAAASRRAGSSFGPPRERPRSPARTRRRAGRKKSPRRAGASVAELGDRCPRSAPSRTALEAGGWEFKARPRRGSSQRPSRAGGRRAKQSASPRRRRRVSAASASVRGAASLLEGGRRARRRSRRRATDAAPQAGQARTLSSLCRIVAACTDRGPGGGTGVVDTEAARERRSGCSPSMARRPPSGRVAPPAQLR